MRKYICEFIGTFILVLLGCGTAAIMGGAASLAGILSISFAFGLSIVAIAYSVGRISGGHVNPAVSLAMLINGKIDIKDFCGYVIAQIAGAFAGAGVLNAILSATDLKDPGLGANGFGDLSAVGLALGAAFVVEVIATCIFVLVILGVTHDEKFKETPGFVIGLVLTLIHIVTIPLTGTSVNPARSLAPAVIVGGDALSQVWLFILAPLVGAAIAAFGWKYLSKED